MSKEDPVNQKNPKRLFATCQCGKVKLEALGPPILTGTCYCTSCQEAGRLFEQLAFAPPVRSIPTVGQALFYTERIGFDAATQFDRIELHRFRQLVERAFERVLAAISRRLRNRNVLHASRTGKSARQISKPLVGIR